MYVCLCNGIRDSELEDLASRGVRAAEEAYAALDVEMSCETCKDCVQEVLDRARDEGRAA